MRRVRVFRHEQQRIVYGNLTRNTPNGKRVCKRTLPGRQTLVWVGPIFVLVQP